MSTTFVIDRLDLFFCPTNSGGKVWGVGIANPLHEPVTIMNQKTVTVWGVKGASQLQAKILETGRSPNSLADKKRQNGYTLQEKCVMRVDIGTGGRGRARFLELGETIEELQVNTDLKYSFLVGRNKAFDMPKDIDEVKSVFISAATKANELVETGSLGDFIVKVKDDCVEFSTDVVRVPNSINFDDKKPFLGSGMFSRYETVFILESAIRAVNAMLGKAVYQLELTIDGESQIKLDDWTSLQSVAAQIDPAALETRVRDLCESMDLVTPRFDIAGAIQTSEIESFF